MRSAARLTRFFGFTLGAYLAASAAPTPLYRIYQERFASSPLLITIVFAAYAIAILAALLSVGALSDHVGRKPVIFAAMLLEMAAMALFLAATGSGWLIAARAVQGMATGVATATLGAALVDVDRKTGQLVNAVAPFAGMTFGVLGSSALVQFGPEPIRLVYAVLLAVFGLQAAILLLAVPETGGTRIGAWRSLRPRITVARRILPRFALITPINVANWALGGFYLSLVPALVVSVTGSKAPLTGGAVVGALVAGGTLTMLARRGRTAIANLAFGAPMASLGIAVVVAGVHLANVPVLVVGALCTGTGFGANFLGCIGAVVPLAETDERAGLLSAFYVESYLAFAGPAIGAGLLVKAYGYEATADIFGVGVVVANLTGLLMLRVRWMPDATARRDRGAGAGRRAARSDRHHGRIP